MGNSRTSRFADGKDLYHLDSVTQQWLRSLVKQRPRREPVSRGILVPSRLLGPARTAPVPVGASARRVGGEVARLLMSNAVGPKIRDLARRHRVDEGDVARLWAQSVYRASEPVRTLPIESGEASA